MIQDALFLLVQIESGVFVESPLKIVYNSPILLETIELQGSPMNHPLFRRRTAAFFMITVILGLTSLSFAAPGIEDVLDGFEELNRHSITRNAEAIVELIAVLDTFVPVALATESERLSILATQARHPEVRTAAFAAWMSGTGSSNEAYWLARYSPSVLIDFVRAIRLVRNQNVRNESFDFIYGLAKTGIVDAGRSPMDEVERASLQLASARALASMTVNDAERVALLTELMAAGTITEADTVAPVYATLAPPKPRVVVEYWTFDILKGDVTATKYGRSFSSGQEMFHVGVCIQCHIVDGRGKTLGPDLTEIRAQYDALGLLEHILDPSLKIDEEYKLVIIEMNDKKEYFGTILDQDETTLSIVENPLKPETAITIQKSDIKLIDLIELSLMPTDLLITMEKNEIWDLLAYLLSANDPENNAFAK